MRRQTYSTIEFVVPFSLEECGRRLVNVPERHDKRGFTGFDPWIVHEDTGAYSFTISRLRYFNGVTPHMAEMRGTLRSINERETQVIARVHINPLLSIASAVMAVVLIALFAPLLGQSPRAALFLIFFLSVVVLFMLMPLRDQTALFSLLEQIFDLAPDHPVRARPQPELGRWWLPLGPRIRMVVRLSLGQSRLNLLNRDYSLLEIVGPKVEQPQFGPVDGNRVSFVMRRMHRRHSWLAGNTNNRFSFVGLQGKLRARNDHETVVEAQVRISLFFCLQLIWAGLFAYVAVLITLGAVTGHMPFCLILFGVGVLPRAFTYFSLPVRDYRALVGHLRSCLDPTRLA